LNRVVDSCFQLPKYKRTCPLAYPGLVPWPILREMQQTKAGRLRMGTNHLKTVLTDIPASIYAMLPKLDLLRLFKRPPRWVL